MDTDYTGDDRRGWEALSEWFFIADPVLDNDNCCPLLIDAGCELLGYCGLIDGFVCAHNVIKGGLGFRRMLQN